MRFLLEALDNVSLGAFASWNRRMSRTSDLTHRRIDSDLFQEDLSLLSVVHERLPLALENLSLTELPFHNQEQVLGEAMRTKALDLRTLKSYVELFEGGGSKKTLRLFPELNPLEEESVVLSSTVSQITEEEAPDGSLSLVSRLLDGLKNERRVSASEGKVKLSVDITGSLLNKLSIHASDESGRPAILESMVVEGEDGRRSIELPRPRVPQNEFSVNIPLGSWKKAVVNFKTKGSNVFFKSIQPEVVSYKSEGVIIKKEFSGPPIFSLSIENQRVDGIDLTEFWSLRHFFTIGGQTHEIRALNDSSTELPTQILAGEDQGLRSAIHTSPFSEFSYELRLEKKKEIPLALLRQFFSDSKKRTLRKIRAEDLSLASGLYELPSSYLGDLKVLSDQVVPVNTWSDFKLTRLPLSLLSIPQAEVLFRVGQLDLQSTTDENPGHGFYRIGPAGEVKILEADRDSVQWSVRANVIRSKSLDEGFELECPFYLFDPVILARTRKEVTREFNWSSGVAWTPELRSFEFSDQLENTVLTDDLGTLTLVEGKQPLQLASREWMVDVTKKFVTVKGGSGVLKFTSTFLSDEKVETSSQEGTLIRTPRRTSKKTVISPVGTTLLALPLEEGEELVEGSVQVAGMEVGMASESDSEPISLTLWRQGHAFGHTSFLVPEWPVDERKTISVVDQNGNSVDLSRVSFDEYLMEIQDLEDEILSVSLSYYTRGKEKAFLNPRRNEIQFMSPLTQETEVSWETHSFVLSGLGSFVLDHKLKDRAVHLADQSPTKHVFLSFWEGKESRTFSVSAERYLTIIPRYVDVGVQFA